MSGDNAPRSHQSPAVYDIATPLDLVLERIR